MKDEDEILPPRKAVTIRPEERSLRVMEPLKNPRGVVSSALSGWQADRRARTNRKLAEFERAQAEYIRARGELGEAVLHTARTVAKLNELPDILEHDAEVRRLQRSRELAEAERAALEARYGREAVEKFKPMNFELGVARKRAQQAEYGDITPPTPSAAEVEPTVLERLVQATRAAVELRNEKLADGEDVQELNEKLKHALKLLAEAGVVLGDEFTLRDP